jgi:hypothetical protein
MTRGQEITAQLSALEADYVENRKLLVTELKEHFGSLFVETFAKSELIESIAWRQYTPYFNDGDPTLFNAHTDEIMINEEDSYGVEWYSWYVGTNYESEIGPEVNVAESLIVSELKSILGKFSDDTLEELFGDHQLITIHKDGRVETEEYYHD